MDMKAVVLKQFGGVEHFTEEQRHVPEPHENEVRIKIRAATANPVDFKTRKGLLGGEPPLILGVDLAGTVESTGRYAADLEPGDEVFGFVDAEGPASNGAYAEYVTVPRSFVSPKPPDFTFQEAAALAMVGLTAYQCLVDKARIQAGEPIFIAGGSGAVGSVAIQLASHFGAEPILTSAGRRESVDYLSRDLGIPERHILDYRNRPVDDMQEELLAMNDGRPVAAAFDFVGGDMKHLCCRAIDFDGRVVTIVEEDEDFRLHAVDAENGRLFAKSASLHTQLLLARARFGDEPYWDIFSHELAILAKLAQGGILRPHRIIQLPDFSATEIGTAHTNLEGRHVDGKLVIPVAI